MNQKNKLAAMIIGFAQLVALLVNVTGSSDALAQISPSLASPLPEQANTLKNGLTVPDPVTFRIRMELGDTEQAREWLEAGLNPNFMGDRLGSGLHIAAWNGNIPLMALFYAHGARLDQNNANDEQPLQLAAYKGHHAAFDWLLSRGAPVNPKPSSPNTRAGAWTALHYAAFAGESNLVNLLLEKGADINARSPNGSTPLMAAIYEGRTEVAEQLLRQGAKRELKNDLDEGALEWAMKFNQTQLARQLADPESFATAASKPKSAWNAQRSQTASPELLSMLSIREVLVERGLSTQQIDNRIAALRAQLARANQAKNQTPLHLEALEVRPSENQKKRTRWSTH